MARVCAGYRANVLTFRWEQAVRCWLLGMSGIIHHGGTEDTENLGGIRLQAYRHDCVAHDRLQPLRYIKTYRSGQSQRISSREIMYAGR